MVSADRDAADDARAAYLADLADAETDARTDDIGPADEAVEADDWPSDYMRRYLAYGASVESYGRWGGAA